MLQTADWQARGKALGAVVSEAWIAAGHSTQPADRARAEAGAAKAFATAGLALPARVRWYPSPKAAQNAVAARSESERVLAHFWDAYGLAEARAAQELGASQVEWREQVYTPVWGVVASIFSHLFGALVAGGGEPGAIYTLNVDLGRLAWLDWCGRVGVARGQVASLQGHMEIARAADHNWCANREEVALCERPSRLALDEGNRLHRTDGPALEYADGFGVWAIHGVVVPPDVVQGREQLTLARINAEDNVEIRRVLIELYGPARFLQDSAAQLVHQDDYGKLWHLPLLGDEPLTMVEVVNSSPEPDGSFKVVFLRVPPVCRTAREACAWTFGLTPGEYVLAKET